MSDADRLRTIVFNWLDSLEQGMPRGEVQAGMYQDLIAMNDATECVNLPPDWRREGLVVVVDSVTGRLLGCMGLATWLAATRDAKD